MFFGSLFPCCMALLISVMACARSSNSAPSKVEGPGVTTASGLQYWDIKVGDGPGVSPGAKLTVQYTGWLENGQKFDSSLDRKQPFEFRLGIDPVIKGWAEGISTMKAGGKRQLRIPPQLAYGERGAGNVIPPNATLIFDVELLQVN
jgi:FKBP-type peptidyl-prolyl cis-trans isomerase FkpA